MEVTISLRCWQSFSPWRLVCTGKWLVWSISWWSEEQGESRSAELQRKCMRLLLVVALKAERFLTLFRMHIAAVTDHKRQKALWYVQNNYGISLKGQITLCRYRRSGSTPLTFSWPSNSIAFYSDMLPGPSPGFSSRGAKNQKEGPKTRRGATFLKYCIGCMQQPGGQTRNGGAHISNEGGHHWPPRWRRPCMLQKKRTGVWRVSTNYAGAEWQ